MSQQQSFVVEGQVAGPNGDGVHGLVVDVADRDLVFYDDLGSTRTRRDGRFRLEYRPDALSRLFDARPEVSIVIRDASGTTVYRGAEVECASGETARFDVEVEQAVVDRHLAHGRTLEPPPGPVLDDDSFSILSAAWDGLAQAGRPVRHGEFRRSWVCPLPPMAKIDELVPDALATIGGDSVAAERFRERLDQFSAQTPVGAEPGPAIEDVRAWQILESSIRDHLGGHGNVVEPVISRDTALALFAATVLAGHARDPAFARGYIDVVANQICPIEHFGTVMRAARGVVRGDSRATRTFENELRTFWGDPDCGPTDKPLPPWPEPDPGPFPPRPNPCPAWPPKRPFVRIPDATLDKWLCQAEMVNTLRGVVGDRYRITSVLPKGACPGQTLVITGSNFGTERGVVRFPAAGGDSIDVTPFVWSDNEVWATVPSTAVTGRLSLIIYNHTVEVCGRFIDLYKHSFSPVIFEGGDTTVTALVESGDCADPRKPLKVRWTSNNADSVSLEITTGDGMVLHSESGYKPNSFYQQVLPFWTSTQTVTVRVTASGPCGTDSSSRTLTMQRPYNLTIHGVELTQAIQYYRAGEHLLHPWNEEVPPNNSVPFVVGKSAILRVYLRSGQNANFDNGILPNVTGTVTLQRRELGEWRTAEDLIPLNGPIDAVDEFPSYDAERSDINSSLNFAMPGSLMSGQLRFTIDVSSPDACTGNKAQTVLNTTVELQQTLRIRAVAIGYQGPNLTPPPSDITIPPPTLMQQIIPELAYTLAAYPVQAAPTVTLIATFTATRPLNTPRTGRCDKGWTPILNAVAEARLNDGRRHLFDSVYHGFVHSDFPINHGNDGCARRGWVSAAIIAPPNTPGDTTAHEIGHQLGLRHAPGGGAAKTNPNWRDYASIDGVPYPDASIGEYGIDLLSPPTQPTLHNPRTSVDLMAYGSQRWISPYTYDYMMNRIELNPTTIPTGATSSGNIDTGMQQDIELIAILGVVNADDSADVLSVSRILTYLPEAGGPRTDVTAELLDEDGTVLASAPVYAQVPDDSGCCGCTDHNETTPPYEFQAMLPTPERGAVLRLRSADHDLWYREASASPPQVENLTARLGKDNQIHFAWTWSTTGEVAPVAWLRWSEDGEEWNGLAVGINQPEYTVDARVIQAQRAQFEVLVHDGFETATTRSESIGLPTRPPTAVVLHPIDGAEVTAGKLHLVACIVDPGSEPTAEQTASWYLDGEIAADGLETWIDATPGEHELELKVPNADPVVVRYHVGTS